MCEHPKNCLHGTDDEMDRKITAETLSIFLGAARPTIRTIKFVCDVASFIILIKNGITSVEVRPDMAIIQAHVVVILE